ncbi:hypothetical protein TGP89_365860 [Toxoplasma gondii p89]|uniref:Uncharacterized protein n=2 Tax=Toxoplasma gondii TaxID=5811 RepID=A0A2T6ITP7_TOXGO|nr:hypothetical protein TGP89_365860 [Toxoplasma gondii p89]PUA88702.1 hypothetical protein TGBR9_365860 [Toxoplasma gondii TgCATBr9]
MDLHIQARSCLNNLRTNFSASGSTVRNESRKKGGEVEKKKTPRGRTGTPKTKAAPDTGARDAEEKRRTRRRCLLSRPGLLYGSGRRAPPSKTSACTYTAPELVFSPKTPLAVSPRDHFCRRDPSKGEPPLSHSFRFRTLRFFLPRILSTFPQLPVSRACSLAFLDFAIQRVTPASESLPVAVNARQNRHPFE